nr:unnamed protein product [Haemonchus contortus]
MKVKDVNQTQRTDNRNFALKQKFKTRDNKINMGDYGQKLKKNAMDYMMDNNQIEDRSSICVRHTATPRV